MALLLPIGARGGSIVAFDNGAPTRMVLPNVPLKAVVAELLDPGNTGDGKAVAYLMWRELLSAISDQSGAGVILARPPGTRRVTDMLTERYHQAAIEIARAQQARMAVWGVVSREGGRLAVETYLSVQGRTSVATLRLFSEPSDAPPIEASLPRTLFNFAPVLATREELFGRAIILRHATALRSAPDRHSPPVQGGASAQALQAIDMKDAWFAVRLAGGRTGYVAAEDVDVPPNRVEPRSPRFDLFSAPSRRVGRLSPVTVLGALPVTNSRYVSGDGGLWFEVRAGDRVGWVQATQVRARYALPVVHFIAGLYRFYAGRYADAAAEFEQFISASGVQESNANLASAHELLGASQLMEHMVFDLRDGSLAPFDHSIALTPYDPAAYVLRAVARLGISGGAEPALQDVGAALKLDRKSDPALKLLAAIAWCADHHGPLRDWINLGGMRPIIERLELQYRQ